MTRLALENCSDLELVPPLYRDEVRQLRKQASLQSESITAKEPVPLFDANRRKRLAELDI